MENENREPLTDGDFQPTESRAEETQNFDTESAAETFENQEAPQEEPEGPSEMKLWVWTLAGLYCYYNVYRLIRDFGTIDSSKERYVMVLAIILFGVAGTWLVFTFGRQAWKIRNRVEKEAQAEREKERERKKNAKRLNQFDNSAAAEEESGEEDSANSGS